MNEVKLGAVSTREDYSESWQALDDDGDGYRPDRRHHRLRAARSGNMRQNGRNGHDRHDDIHGGTIPVATMRGLCPKDHDVGCTIEINDVTTQFFIGTIPIVDGVT
jgi:hypothetical protein